jgi:hypothetical protein
MPDAPTPARLTVPRILWAALLGSTLITLGVLFTLHDPQKMSEATMPVLSVLAAMALFSATTGSVMPGMLRKKALLAAKVAVEEVDDPNAVGSFRATAAKVRVFANSTNARAVALRSYQTAFILGMAFAEGISIMGFVAGMLGAPVLYVLPFWVVTWVLMLIRFPTDKAVDEPLERAYGAKLR